MIAAALFGFLAVAAGILIGAWTAYHATRPRRSDK